MMVVLINNLDYFFFLAISVFQALPTGMLPLENNQ
jgi:hypothetical protein